MNGATIEPAQVGEDILCYGFSDEAIEAAAGCATASSWCSLAALTSTEHIIVLDRRVPAR